jgi:hypothetical protein
MQLCAMQFSIEFSFDFSICRGTAPRLILHSIVSFVMLIRKFNRVKPSLCLLKKERVVTSALSGK